MKQEDTSVISSDEVMLGVYLVWLESPQIASQAKPGQFVMVCCGEETVLRRPLSIHQIAGSRLALLFNIAGKGTRWLSQRQAGDIIDLLGPLGNGFCINPNSKNLLLVAGGIGIAPLRFLADVALQQGKNITLLMGAQRAVQLLSTELLPSKMTLAITTNDGSMGNEGHITQSISGHANWVDQVFACGPVPMYQAMAQMSELKNKPVQISLEVRMGCGLGICYGCTVKTRNGLKQVCKDGPVFNLDNILWGEQDFI